MRRNSAFASYSECRLTPGALANRAAARTVVEADSGGGAVIAVEPELEIGDRFAVYRCEVRLGGFARRYLAFVGDVPPRAFPLAEGQGFEESARRFADELEATGLAMQSVRFDALAHPPVRYRDGLRTAPPSAAAGRMLVERARAVRETIEALSAPEPGSAVVRERP